jgi:hypothetical protein
MTMNWTAVLARAAIAPVLVTSCGYMAHAAETPVDLVAVTTPVELASFIPSSNLAKECAIGQMTGDRVIEELKHSYPKVNAVATVPTLTGDQRALRLSVIDMFGLGGGGWSGAKSMTVRVELVSPAGMIARHDFHRATKSLMGMVSGTCPMMEKIATTIGADIGKWLEKAGRQSALIAPAVGFTPDKRNPADQPAAAASAAESTASAPAN